MSLNTNQNILLEIGNLRYKYPEKKFEKEKDRGYVINDLSMAIRRNHRHGLIGESTCGKTTLGKIITLTLPEISEGYIKFNQRENIFQYSSEEAKKYHKQVQMIYQSPEASLNPGMKVYEIIAEAIKARLSNGEKKSRGEIKEEVEYYLKQVSLKDKRNSYPDTLSGGEKRRISIIRALAMKPSLIIADEPFSSLDASLRNEILKLFLNDFNDREVSYLFILHDLDVAKYACETISIMYSGRILEEGKSQYILSKDAIRHPYTDTLFHAQYEHKSLIPKFYNSSNFFDDKGCIYKEKCYLFQGKELDCKEKERCETESPDLSFSQGDHRIACHFRIHEE